MNITANTRTARTTPAYATTAAKAAVDAMNAAALAAVVAGDLAIARRAVVAAMAAYRAAVDKARGDSRGVRLDAVMAAGAELESAMEALANAKAKASASAASASAASGRWEEMDLELIQAIDALMAE